MKLLKNLQKAGLKGKRVLVRADFNVPVRNGKVTEAMRIDETLLTIKFLLKNGAQVILISHIGDDGSTSLRPVAKYLLTKKLSVKFVSDFASVAKAKESIILMENIRRFEGEKKNDPVLAKQLAMLADLYVNEAFSVSHREHASVVGVPKLLPSYAGLHLVEELDYLKKVFKPDLPLVMVVGGAKFKTKFPLLKKFCPKAQIVCVGGALGNTLIKARGYEVGVSLVDDITPEIKKMAKSKKIILPVDFVVTGKKKGDFFVKKVGELTTTDKIVDPGPSTSKLFAEKIAGAKTLLWNGPLGLIEDGFVHATIFLARNIPKGCFSVLGGGDSVEALRQARLLKKLSFVSTGGGAMLQYLATGKLPGISALK
ncbi:MAG: phosphoglycerate kinase [Candidatus Paceibacterota bacterium]|jgi:phosphoglycerate kinase